jgi:hypothetical protein
MDDRAGEVIEGVADVQNWDVPQIQQSAEAPINTVNAGQQREREPARASAPQEDPQQAARAEHVDDDGVVHETGRGPQTAPQEAPQQNGGRRRGGRGGAQNGDLAFPED